MAVFAVLFGYYSWQLKFAESEKIEKFEQQFSHHFTIDESLAKTPSASILEKDIAAFIRPNNPTFGDAAAPITIVAFLDFECPFSQESYPIFKEAALKYEPVIQVIFKHFPLSTIHPSSLDASLAAECAREQNKFWDYYNAVFEQKKLTKTSLSTYAKELGLNEKIFTACLDGKKFVNQVQQDLRDGLELGVRGTPTYFVNNKKIEGVMTKEQWDNIILKEMEK